MVKSGLNQKVTVAVVAITAGMLFVFNLGNRANTEEQPLEQGEITQTYNGIEDGRERR